MVPDVPKAWRFVCPCCGALHALSEGQMKGEAYYCRRQDIIGDPKQNDVDAFLDAIGMTVAPKCDIAKKPEQPTFDPYAY